MYYRFKLQVKTSSREISVRLSNKGSMLDSLRIEQMEMLGFVRLMMPER